jgi:hypothetical protein
MSANRTGKPVLHTLFSLRTGFCLGTFLPKESSSFEISRHNIPANFPKSHVLLPRHSFFLRLPIKKFILLWRASSRTEVHHWDLVSLTRSPSFSTLALCFALPRICMYECRGLDSRSHALHGYLRFRDVFGVTKVATEKSDLRHSALVLLHSGGSRW